MSTIASSMDRGPGPGPGLADSAPTSSLTPIPAGPDLLTRLSSLEALQKRLAEKKRKRLQESTTTTTTGDQSIDNSEQIEEKKTNTEPINLSSSTIHYNHISTDTHRSTAQIHTNMMMIDSSIDAFESSSSIIQTASAASPPNLSPLEPLYSSSYIRQESVNELNSNLTPTTNSSTTPIATVVGGGSVPVTMVTDLPKPAEYNPNLNIPSSKSGSHIPQHWRTFDPTHSLFEDLSQNFVNGGSRSNRPVNFVHDEIEDQSNGDTNYEAYRDRRTKLVEEANKTTPYMAKRVDLSQTNLIDLLGINSGMEFDVIVIDPPWQEYQDRKGGGRVDSNHIETAASTATRPPAERIWSYTDLAKLPIDRLGAEPSLLFLWCCSQSHRSQAHALIKNWGYHVVDCITWIKTNKSHPKVPGYTTGGSIFQQTFEHCLLGIKGQDWILRDRDLPSRKNPSPGIPYHERQELGLVQFVAPGMEIDVIIDETTEEGSTAKPIDLYHRIEQWCVGRRRLELFGTDHNLRAGWLTLGAEISTGYDNFDLNKYRARFEHPVQLPSLNNWNQQQYAHAPDVPYGRPFDSRHVGHYLPFDPVSESLRTHSPPPSQEAKRRLPPGPRRGWKGVTTTTTTQTNQSVTNNSNYAGGGTAAIPTPSPGVWHTITPIQPQPFIPPPPPPIIPPPPLMMMQGPGFVYPPPHPYQLIPPFHPSMPTPPPSFIPMMTQPIPTQPVIRPPPPSLTSIFAPLPSLNSPPPSIASRSPIPPIPQPHPSPPPTDQPTRSLSPQPIFEID